MAEVIGAVLVFFLGALFGPHLERFSWALLRRFSRRPRAMSLFDVHFVNEQGQNIYVKNDDPKLNVGDLSWFRVKTHFTLRVKEHIVLTNIELTYPEIVALPGKQDIEIDGQQQRTDGRYGLVVPKVLETETAIDVRLFRTFHCDAEKTWEGDYKQLMIILEFTTRKADGFHRCLVVGTLHPGGEVSDVAIESAAA